MANMLLNNRANVYISSILIRQLSSFKNNRTKAGFISILPNDDFNNIWSENNWTELGKQFNKVKYFPLPGQTGIHFETNEINLEQRKKLVNTNKKNRELLTQNLNYLLNEPLVKEAQIIKIKEATKGLRIFEEMDQKLNGDSTNAPIFELKSYPCPKSLMEDFQNYFRMISLGDIPMTVVTVSFKTENDMATWNNKVDTERELLTDKFVLRAQEICELLGQEGYWADFIDPSSGTLTKGAYTHATFYETDERYRHLGFEIIDNGCCKVISHHEWGTKSYVGCILTNAPNDSRFLQEINSKFN